MALIVTEPIKTVSGLLTKALAARSQVRYVFRREDYGWARILDDNNNVGFIRVLLLDALGDISSEFAPDESIYINDDTGEYTGIHTIRAVDFDATRVNLRLNTAYTVDSLFPANAYLNNLTTRENYRIAIRIFLGDDTLMFDTTFRYVPNQAGELTTDFSTLTSTYLSLNPFSTEYYLEVTEEWLGSSESPQNLSTLQAVYAKKQLLKLGGANMWEYLLREGSDAAFDFAKFGAPIPFVSGAEPWDLITATKLEYATTGTNLISTQSLYYPDHEGEIAIGSIVRMNFAAIYRIQNYVAQGDVEIQYQFQLAGAFTGDNYRAIETITGNTGNVAWADSHEFTTTALADRVLFRFTRSSAGSNFDVLFTMASANGHFLTIEPPVIGKFLTKFENPLIWRGWNRTNSALIDQEYNNRTGQAGTKWKTDPYDVNKVRITDNGLQENPIGTITPRVDVAKITYNEPADTFYIGIARSNTVSDVHFTEVLFYELKGECPQPIMLDWINGLGGVDQWLFTISQLIEDTSGEGVLAERVISDDIEFVTRTKQRFPGSSVMRITCTAEDLTGDQITALKEIKETNSLRVYLSKDGANFIDAVVVQDFSTSANSKDLKHKYSITIEFPDDFNFFDGKLY